MISINFCYWLQGYLGENDNTYLTLDVKKYMNKCTVNCEGAKCYCEQTLINALKYGDLQFLQNCSIFEITFLVENMQIVEINTGMLINVGSHEYNITSDDAFGDDELIMQDLNSSFETIYFLADGEYSALLYVNYVEDCYHEGSEWDAYCELKYIIKL